MTTTPDTPVPVRAGILRFAAGVLQLIVDDIDMPDLHSRAMIVESCPPDMFDDSAGLIEELANGEDLAAPSRAPLSYQMVTSSGAKVGEPVGCYVWPAAGSALVSQDGLRRRVLAVAEHIGAHTAEVMVGGSDGW